MMRAATTATTSPARTTHGAHGDHSGSNLAAASMYAVYRLSGFTGKERPKPPRLLDDTESDGGALPGQQQQSCIGFAVRRREPGRNQLVEHVSIIGMSYDMAGSGLAEWRNRQTHGT
jgi:hypothetical protein